jgi:hypothetical protein
MLRLKSQFNKISGTPISETWKQFLISPGGISVIVILVTAMIVRLTISFSHDLILGMDGGYYPVQVRNILKTGLLAFNDVPLYFYFCASIIKLISFFGFTVTNETIILVIKIIDSIALPILLIPLYKIVSRKGLKIPLFAGLAILLFSVFTFSPFVMLGDLQKNAFAFPFLFLFIYLFENYLITHERNDLLLAMSTLCIIALAHFGVFVFGLTFVTISMFVVYRKKAVLPSILILLVGFSVIYLFDANRALRLITFWNVIFDKPGLNQEPLPFPLLINAIISYLLLIFGFFQYRKHRSEMDTTTGYMILTLIALISIFAFPFYETQYVQRFSAMLFIPQVLMIVYLIRINQKLALPFSISLVLLTTVSIFMYFGEAKKPVIDDQEFRDLQNLKSHLPVNRDSTIIITRHGLEFWTAWALNVKVGNDKSIDLNDLGKYRNIIILQQKKESGLRPPVNKPFPAHRFSKDGKAPLGPPMGPPMERPMPENFKPIFSSPYFSAFQLERE